MSERNAPTNLDIGIAAASTTTALASAITMFEHRGAIIEGLMTGYTEESVGTPPPSPEEFQSAMEIHAIAFGIFAVSSFIAQRYIRRL